MLRPDVLHVAIVGSRDYPDLDQVRSFVRGLARKHPGCCVVSGGARGVDRTAEDEARKIGLWVESVRPFSAKGVVDQQTRWGYDVTRWIGQRQVESFYQGTFDEWRSFRDAAFGRNEVIVRRSDVVVAFTTGSNGTANTLDHARRLGKSSWIFTPNDQPA